MRVVVALLGLLTACDRGAPEVCDNMCVEATALYGDCLDAWGLDWTAAGYDDRAAFQGSCETWAWEMDLVHRQALRDGDTDDEAWLDRTCTERAALFARDDASCDDYTGIDWNAVPWSEASQ